MPEPAYIAAWLGIAFFLAAGINSILKLSDRLRGHPPAEQLKLGADEIARRVKQLEHDAKDAPIRRRAIYEKIEAVDADLRAQMEEDRKALNTQIGQLRESVAGLERDTVNQNQQLRHIEAKLDRLIERR